MSVGNNLRRHRILYVCFTLKICQSRRSKSKSPSKCLACAWHGFLRSRECPGTVQSVLTTTVTSPNYKNVLFVGALVLISSPNISLTNIFAVRDAVSRTCSRHRLQILTHRQGIFTFFTVFHSYSRQIPWYYFHYAKTALLFSPNSATSLHNSSL